AFLPHPYRLDFSSAYDCDTESLVPHSARFCGQQLSRNASKSAAARFRSPPSGLQSAVLPHAAGPTRSSASQRARTAPPEARSAAEGTGDARANVAQQAETKGRLAYPNEVGK